jgi:hypothetical protein
MKTYKQLLESYNVPLVVIDVQPEYHFVCKTITPDVVSLINKHSKVKIFYVGIENSGIGQDSKNDVIDYYLDYGLDENRIRSLSFHEKGYGFFRSWMPVVDKHFIIKVLREMFIRRIYDSRDFIGLKEFLGKEYKDWMDDDPLIIPDINIRDLKEYNNCYICGGGRSECLEELTILFNTFNIKYTIIKRLTY